MDDKLESGRTIEALRKKNLEGKKTFIDELRRQKSPKSVALLLEILCDESWYLRELAIAGLVEAGDLATGPLRHVLASGLWYTRAAAARALGRMGCAAASSEILNLLDESNRTVREAAVDAVQAMSNAGALESLCVALAQESRELRAARLLPIAAAAPDLAARLESGADAAAAARFSTSHSLPISVPSDAGGMEGPFSREPGTPPRVSDSSHEGGGGAAGAP